MEMVPTPKDFLEYLAGLRFSPGANARIQALMDRSNEGLLTAEEQEELAGLASLSQDMSIARARALLLLGRKFAASTVTS